MASEKQGRSWHMILAGAVLFGLCFLLVWLNVRMVSLSYDIKELQRKLESEKTLNAKLEVERMRLLSDSRLESLAERFGLQPPSKGQIRRLP